VNLVCLIYLGPLLQAQGTPIRKNEPSAQTAVAAQTPTPPDSAQKNAAETLKLRVETFKLIFEALAFAGAAAFFGYKALSGYLISNLTLTLTSDRQAVSKSGQDYVTIVAQLKKGDRGAVTLHDALATLHLGNGKAIRKRFPAARRLSSLKVNGRLQTLESRASRFPMLNLPPGEETHFATYFKVPAGQPCVIDVTILGAWRWHGKTRYQWRASLVSLPK
jgi:hypothetical protein